MKTKEHFIKYALNDNIKTCKPRDVKSKCVLKEAIEARKDAKYGYEELKNILISIRRLGINNICCRNSNCEYYFENMCLLQDKLIHLSEDGKCESFKDLKV